MLLVLGIERALRGLGFRVESFGKWNWKLRSQHAGLQAGHMKYEDLGNSDNYNSEPYEGSMWASLNPKP